MYRFFDIHGSVTLRMHLGKWTFLSEGQASAGLGSLEAALGHVRSLLGGCGTDIMCLEKPLLINRKLTS